MSRDFYPTGQLTLGGEVLVQVDEVSIEIDNALKLEATLANKNGTPVTGMVTAKVSWKMKVDNNGPEIPMVSSVTAAAPMPLGFKFQGGVVVNLNATAGSAKLGQKLGDVFAVDCSAMGSIVDSSGI